MSQALKIGLFGFGCVGQGLYKVLNQSRGIEAEIVKICVKNRQKQRPLAAHHFTFDPLDILDDPEIAVVVELIDDADAAFTLVSQALKKGKAVVSANKKMIATHFPELYALQQETGQPFLYEAACGGGIPIIRNLEEYYDNDLLHALEGVVNGSTNYILGQQDRGLDFGEALAIARERGFAESDPSLDLSGWDARYKLAILITHAFGEWIPAEQILCRGISGTQPSDFWLAKQRGRRLKLLAKARRGELGLWASVLPTFVPEEHPLSRVEQEYNGILLEGAFSEKQFLSGKGAGAYPTGSAVLSDISALRYGYRYEYRKRHQLRQAKGLESQTLNVYLRYGKPKILQDFPLLELKERFHSEGLDYLIGKVDSEDLARFIREHPTGDYFLAEWPEPEVIQTQQVSKTDIVLV